MARVSIEERAAAAAKKLARVMGWTRAAAIGRLYFFWHDSQELEQTHCTAQDVALWMDVDADQEPDLIPAMISAGFLIDAKDGSYLICGNEKHIEALTQRRDASRENGKLGGRPPKPKVSPNNLDVTQPVNLDEPSRETQPNPAENLLCSAVLCSALLCSAGREDCIYLAREAPPVDNSPPLAAHTSIGKLFPDEVVEKCVQAWLDTLAKHGIKTERLQPFEQGLIFQALKKYGPDGTQAALYGIRFEPKPTNGSYDPGAHLRLSRVFDPELIDKWWNLARRDRDKRAKGAA